MNGLASLWHALIADYRFLYGGRSETRAQQALRGLRRFALDPSLHAVVLMRLVTTGPRTLSPLPRWLLRHAHGIVIAPDCELGPGLILPHPCLIRLGSGTRIGARARIYHNVQIEGAVLGEDITIHCNARLERGVTVGDAALVGANCIVSEDIPEGGRFVRNALRVAAGSAGWADV